MSTATVFKTFPKLVDYKRKAKSKYLDMEIRLFEHKTDESETELIIENSDGSMEMLDNQHFYDVEDALNAHFTTFVSGKSSITLKELEAEFANYTKTIDKKLIVVV